MNPWELQKEWVRNTPSPPSGGSERRGRSGQALVLCRLPVSLGSPVQPLVVPSGCSGHSDRGVHPRIHMWELYMAFRRAHIPHGTSPVKRSWAASDGQDWLLEELVPNTAVSLELGGPEG